MAKEAVAAAQGEEQAGKTVHSSGALRECRRPISEGLGRRRPEDLCLTEVGPEDQKTRSCWLMLFEFDWVYLVEFLPIQVSPHFSRVCLATLGI